MFVKKLVLLQLMAQQAQYAQFFFQLADLGSALGHSPLRETARSLLQLMPADTHTIEQLHLTFVVSQTSPTTTSEVNDETASPTIEKSLPTIDSLFFSSSPSQALYYLQVKYFFLHSQLINKNLKF